jgi:hypothetical protein
MKNIVIRIRGRQPLLMHNEQLANPLKDCAKALAEFTKKRNKTLDDHAAIAELEFKGGIYHDEKIGPYVPNSWLLKSIENGAKKQKLGKLFKAAVQIIDPMVPIIYEGPRKIKDLYVKGFWDQRCVGVQKAKTVRTRPCFQKWELQFDLEYDETLVDPGQIKRAIEHAGIVEGLGDYRPRFGTFALVDFKC